VPRRGPRNYCTEGQNRTQNARAGWAGL